MVGARVEDACDMMARAIKHLREHLDRKSRRVGILQERLEMLKEQPTPDQAQITELENDIRELEEELESDRAQLAAFEEEFAASCGP